MSSRRHGGLYARRGSHRVCLVCARVVPIGGRRVVSWQEWAAPGGDWAGTRYSTLTQISARNIKQLGGAWVMETPDRTEATPIVKDGRHVSSSRRQAVILALSIRQPAEHSGPSSPRLRSCGKRGIGIGDGCTFLLPQRDSNVIGHQQETG
jgi:hypothetical protein